MLNINIAVSLFKYRNGNTVLPKTGLIELTVFLIYWKQLYFLFFLYFSYFLVSNEQLSSQNDFPEQSMQVKSKVVICEKRCQLLNILLYGLFDSNFICISPLCAKAKCTLLCQEKVEVP